MPKDIRLLGVPFQETSEGYNINALLPYHSDVMIDWNASTQQRPASFTPYAPQIQIQQMATGGYDIYYFVGNARYRDSAGKAAYKPGWCNKNGALADAANGGTLPGTLTPGASVWFKDSTNENPVVTSAGQVISKDVEISCPADFRCRAPAFPKEFNLNEAGVSYEGIDATIMIDWSASTQQRPASFTPYAPQIQIQQSASGGYDIYYYVGNARYRDEQGKAAYKPGWCNKNGALADTANGGTLPGNVPVNGAFWTKGVSKAFTMKFTAK